MLPAWRARTAPGKSSILDAITWSLWGKARSNSPDDLIHQGETEMRVALTFLQGAGSLPGHPAEQGRQTRQLVARAPGLGSFRRKLARACPTPRSAIPRIASTDLLRLDHETFVNSAFLLQGRADEFTTKTPAQRKQVLANILGLDIWDVYEGRARDKISRTKAAIERLEGRLAEIDRELGKRELHEEQLKSAQDQAGRPGILN